MLRDFWEDPNGYVANPAPITPFIHHYIEGGNGWVDRAIPFLRDAAAMGTKVSAVQARIMLKACADRGAAKETVAVLQLMAEVGCPLYEDACALALETCIDSGKWVQPPRPPSYPPTLLPQPQLPQPQLLQPQLACHLL
jgi:hypothetical protein